MQGFKGLNKIQRSLSSFLKHIDKNLHPKPKLVLVGGFPGSGKSMISKRLSRRLHRPRLSFDDLRSMLYNKRYPDDVGKDCGLQKRYATSNEEEYTAQWTAKALSLEVGRACIKRIQNNCPAKQQLFTIQG